VPPTNVYTDTNAGHLVFNLAIGVSQGFHVLSLPFLLLYTAAALLQVKKQSIMYFFIPSIFYGAESCPLKIRPVKSGYEVPLKISCPTKIDGLIEK
jgi:hypothetical protein